MGVHNRSWIEEDHFTKDHTNLHKRTQQFPGSSTSVHSDHSQNLKKPKSSKGGSSKKLARTSNWHDCYWSYYHNKIYKSKKRLFDEEQLTGILAYGTEWTPHEAQSTHPSLVSRSTPCRPHSEHKLDGKPNHHDDFLNSLVNSCEQTSKNVPFWLEY